jgi:hypothetical protein
LVQFLDAGEAADTSNRRQVETFFTAGSITAGDFVSLDVTQAGADKALFIVQSPAAAGDGKAVGVALDTATGTANTPAQVRVVVAGYAAGANVATGSAAGTALTTTGTAGRAASATYIGNGSGAAAVPLPNVIAVALTTAAANTAEVMVIKRF